MSAQPLPFAQQAVLVREALALGITPERLRQMRNRGELIQLRKGLLVHACVWESADAETRHRIALTGLIRSHPGSFASHDSAARLLGLPGEIKPEMHAGIPVCHITKSGQARRDGWAYIHGSKVPVELVTSVDGVPSSNVVRCSIEQAATTSEVRAYAHIDAAMRSFINGIRGSIELRDAVHDTTIRQRALRTWHEGLDHFIGHRWVTRVRAAVIAAEPAAESYLESASRFAMALAGVPKPRCGMPVRLRGKTFWLDFGWEEYRVAGEADGLGKYAALQDLVQEKRREEALKAAGWTVVRWGWEEAVTHPHLMIERIWQALRRRTP